MSPLKREFAYIKGINAAFKINTFLFIKSAKGLTAFLLMAD